MTRELLEILQLIERLAALLNEVSISRAVSVQAAMIELDARTVGARVRLSHHG